MKIYNSKYSRRSGFLYLMLTSVVNAIPTNVIKHEYNIMQNISILLQVYTRHGVNVPLINVQLKDYLIRREN